MIPFNITIINTLLIIIVALPIIVLDIKNDLDIKKIYQYYLKEKKIPEYKDKTKILKVQPFFASKKSLGNWDFTQLK